MAGYLGHPLIRRGAFAARLEDGPSKRNFARALGQSTARALLLDGSLLALFVAGIYFLPLTQLTIRGEESRWAHVASEMLRTGDWIVPREQGQPLLSRPPLGSCLIAASSWCRGGCDLVAVRLPSVGAVLLTILVIYGYARTFLPRAGALASALAFATMAQVLELGRLAETEAVFTCLLSSALLVWHGSWMRRWRGGWIAGYGLAALAALTKGPQAPIYFIGAVVAYLVLTRNSRALFCRAHLVGLLTFVAILATWQLPFIFMAGSAAAWKIWTGDTALRLLHPPTLRDVCRHVLSYPWEIMACTLPWSPLLLGYADPRLREKLGAAKRAAVFVAVCLAVSFPTCWLMPTAKTRYFMPLYPCLAVLIGIIIQRCLEASREDWRAHGWRTFLFVGAMGMIVVGGGAMLAGVLDIALLRRFQQPIGVAIPFGLELMILAGLTCRWALGPDLPKTLGGVVAVAAFAGLTSSTLVLSDQVRKSVDAAPAMARLLAVLPADQPLFSFAPLHSLFVYYCPRPIVIVARPHSAADLDSRVTYFCFENYGLDEPTFPFPWELVGEVNCDRYHEATPFCRVFVGRRLPPETGPAGPPLRRPAH